MRAGPHLDAGGRDIGRVPAGHLARWQGSLRCDFLPELDQSSQGQSHGHPFLLPLPSYLDPLSFAEDRMWSTVIGNSLVTNGVDSQLLTSVRLAFSSLVEAVVQYLHNESHSPSLADQSFAARPDLMFLCCNE